MNALYTPLPPYTADFHIINLVRTEFTLPFHHKTLSRFTLSSVSYN